MNELMEQTACDILFTHSYFLRFDPKQWRTGRPYAPLGTIYAAALMREKGYAVALHDVQFVQSADEVKGRIATLRPAWFVVYDDGFNYLTKMCLTNMREAAFQMIRIAKESGCKVIVASSDATDHFRAYLEEGADYILLGEAEQSLLELVNAIDRDLLDPGCVAGIAYKKGTEVITTLKRKVMTDLDALPLPAWDLIDLETYRKWWQKHAGYFSVNIGTTRGCPFQCNWCAKPIYGNRYHARSPQHVVRELKLLKDLVPFEHVWFCDDIFGLRPGWVGEFADLVIKEGLEFHFKIQSRADLLLKEEYVAALARAGCSEVWMGAESGSQKILDAMDKGIRVEQVERATALLRSHGILPSFFIQFGYPGETKEDILLTVNMINRLQPHQIGISVSYPLPGTVFYEKVKEELRRKSNWSDSDDLALMFHNTFPPAFYRRLHRYVHRNYRRHLAITSLKLLMKQPWMLNRGMIKNVVAALYFSLTTTIDRFRLTKLETK